MKIAIHHNTLKKITNGEVDQLVTHFALSSKVSVTPSILATYQQLLSHNPIFTSWFSAALSHRRIDVANPSESPTQVKSADLHTNEYGSASYFAGSHLLLSAGDFDENATSSLQSIGTTFIFSNSTLPNEVQGDNPFRVVNTKTNGTIDFNILDQYIRPEDTITIYDKYINNTSIELIKHIARQLKPNSTLLIYHADISKSNLLSSTQIKSLTTAANPQISVTCQHCSKQFAKDNHDRYIFFGNRCQATFTAGLDCFGLLNTTTGKRSNRKSTIAFFDTSKAGTLKIEGKNGSQHVVRHYSA